MSYTAISKAITKKYQPFVLEVSEDCNEFEVVLKDGFINQGYGESMWIFDKSNLEDMSVKEMVEDLKLWLSDVVEE